jgi:hypothetical protein
MQLDESVGSAVYPSMHSHMVTLSTESCFELTASCITAQKVVAVSQALLSPTLQCSWVGWYDGCIVGTAPGTIGPSGVDGGSTSDGSRVGCKDGAPVANASFSHWARTPSIMSCVAMLVRLSKKV